MLKIVEKSRMRKKKFFIQTFGCQMNVYDSERIGSVLEGEGYEQAEGPEEADLIFLNTCSVREKPVQKVYSALGRFREVKKESPPHHRGGRMRGSAGRGGPAGAVFLPRLCPGNQRTPPPKNDPSRAGTVGEAAGGARLGRKGRSLCLPSLPIRPDRRFQVSFPSCRDATITAPTASFPLSAEGK